MEEHRDLIEEDGRNDTPTPERRTGNGRGLWALVGLAIGLGVAGLFASSAGQSEDPESTTIFSTSTSLDNADPVVGIGEVIPGFPDGLNVVVSPGGGRAFEVVTWPLEGPPIRRSIPLGDLDTFGTIRFDASGQFLAALVDDGSGTFSLESGRVNSFGVVDGDVSGFAWHDSNPADLAWTAVDGDVVSLLVGEDGAWAEPRVVVEDLGFDGVVTAFGDWGYAVEDAEMLLSDDRAEIKTRILGPGGEFLFELEGRVVASKNSGVLAARAGTSISFVSIGEGAVPVVEPSEELEALEAAFSPDGRQIAASNFVGLVVIDLDTGEEVADYPIRVGNGPNRWSSDGRFLVIPGFRGALVIDTESDEIYTVLGNDGTRTAAPAPIGGN